jgi:hypothetical protein
VALVAAHAPAAARAPATPPTIEFRIPAGSLSAVLVRFAVTARISLGLDELGACAAQGRGLSGRHTVEDGLQLILNGTGCRYRLLDTRAYIVQPVPQTTFAAALASPAGESTSVELAELVVLAPRGTTPGEAGDLQSAEDLATALSNLFGGHFSDACEGCAGSEALPLLGGAAVPAPSAGPDVAAEVAEPGSWAIMLLGLGVLGAGLRRRRRAAGGDREAVAGP